MTTVLNKRPSVGRLPTSGNSLLAGGVLIDRERMTRVLVIVSSLVKHPSVSELARIVAERQSITQPQYTRAEGILKACCDWW